MKANSTFDYCKLDNLQRQKISNLHKSAELTSVSSKKIKMFIHHQSRKMKQSSNIFKSQFLFDPKFCTDLKVINLDFQIEEKP